MDTVGERIRRIRELRGLSQKELAARAGIHEVLMRRYEYGDRKPKADQLKKIAEALRVPEAFFHMPNVETYEAIFALIYELIDFFGDISLEIYGGNISIMLPTKDKISFLEPLVAASNKKNAETNNNKFQEWLLNYKYAHRFITDPNTGRRIPKYPELSISSASDESSIKKSDKTT